MERGRNEGVRGVMEAVKWTEKATYEVQSGFAGS